MALLLAGALLLLLCVLLPGTAGVSLTQRFRRLTGAPGEVTVVRRTLPAWLPGRRLLPLLPARYRQAMARRLMEARLDGRWTAEDLLAVKVSAMLLLAAVSTLLWYKTGSAGYAAYGAVECFAGWYLPDFWVKRRVSARQAQVARELPHVLSSLAICLGSGLSLRSALLELARLHPEGALGQDLQVAADQVLAGASPGEALAALAQRSGSRELAQAIAVLQQHAERGSSDAARRMAEEAQGAWLRRKHRAEAIAQTASLRLFLPQLLLNLPALVLVLLGPAVLGLLAYTR